MADDDTHDSSALRSRVRGEAEFAEAVALGQVDRDSGRLIVHDVFVQALTQVFEEAKANNGGQPDGGQS